MNRPQECWSDLLPGVVFSYNTGIQSSLKASPYFLLYGRAPRPFLQIEASRPIYNEDPGYDLLLPRRLKIANEIARENLRKATDKQIANRAKIETEVPFNVGDTVLLKRGQYPPGERKKLLPRFLGPFIIDRQASPVLFVIRDLSTNKSQKVHANRLRLLPSRSIPMVDDETVVEEQPAVANPPTPAGILATPLARTLVRTRTRGPVQDLPNVMSRPLEYATRTIRRAMPSSSARSSQAQQNSPTDDEISFQSVQDQLTFNSDSDNEE
jgi:hypothetical protein